MTHSAEKFGIYLHWPFCAAKCPYCDFNSHVRHTPPDQPRFAKAFDREMRSIAARTGPRTVSSIFIGGGTPSLMLPQTVQALLDSIANYWTIDANAEITMEANPSSVEADRFRGYRSAGVNRLSLGVQALNDQDLQSLGRLHDVKTALAAIKLAREIFPRLSFDLIYARPDQSLQQWEKELHQAIDLAADHLSLYQLTLEPETAFYRLYQAGKFSLPSADHSADLYALTQDITDDRGLPAYEISNHAQPGAESQHNLIYWRYHQYAGFGPGAHGRFNENNKRTVTITEKLPEKWLQMVEQQSSGIIEEEYLDHAQQGDEMLLMGLRLYEGLDIDRYQSLSGQKLPTQTLIDLQQQALVEMVGNSHLRATAKGRIVLDHIITELAAS